MKTAQPKSQSASEVATQEATRLAAATDLTTLARTWHTSYIDSQWVLRQKQFANILLDRNFDAARMTAAKNVWVQELVHVRGLRAWRGLRTRSCFMWRS